jgi:hypothetical protein
MKWAAEAHAVHLSLFLSYVSSGQGWVKKAVAAIKKG